jgi:outer membrane biosynthesis protein TonB
MKYSMITLLAAFSFVAMAQAEPVGFDSVGMDCYNFNEPVGAPKNFAPKKKVTPQPKPEVRPEQPAPAPKASVKKKKQATKPAPKPEPTPEHR